MPSAAATSAEAPLRPGAAGTPSNSPIEASQSARRPAAARARQRTEKVGRHRPGIEVDALGAGGGGVEGGIDIVGAGLEPDDGNAARA